MPIYLITKTMLNEKYLEDRISTDVYDLRPLVEKGDLLDKIGELASYKK